MVDMNNSIYSKIKETFSGNPRLKEEFFARSSKEVAPDLLGRCLVRKISKYDVVKGIITETGAFYGHEGPRTPGKEGMYYAPGKLYIWPFRGKYLMNIATGGEGYPSVVWIKGLYLPEEEKLLGPGKLTEELKIDGCKDGKSIKGTHLWIEGKPAKSSKIEYLSPKKVKMAENCLGYYRLKSIREYETV